MHVNTLDDTDQEIFDDLKNALSNYGFEFDNLTINSTLTKEQSKIISQHLLTKYIIAYNDSEIELQRAVNLIKIRLNSPPPEEDY